MSQKHEDAVRRIAAAAGHLDLESLLALTDPAVEWHSSISVIAEGGAYHGHAGVRQYVSDLDEAFDAFEIVLTGVLSAGDVTIAVGTVTYRGKTSGVEQQDRLGWVLRFRDGRVTYLRAFRDPESVLGALAQ